MRRSDRGTGSEREGSTFEGGDHDQKGDLIMKGWKNEANEEV